MARRRLAGNMASMALWQAGNYIIPLLTFPYLTRTLDVHGYGAFVFSFAIVTYATLVTDWGFGLSASAEVARHRDDRAAVTRIFWNVVAAKAMLALGALAVLAACAAAVPSLRAIAPVLAGASLLVVANVITMNWCLQGLERLGAFAIGATCARALTLPAMFLLVHDPGDAWRAALVQAAGALLAGLFSILLLVRTRAIDAPVASVAGALAQLREGWHLFVSTAAVNFYTTTSSAVLGFLGGPVALAPYGAADRLRAAAQGVIQPISQAVYPHSTRLMAQDRAAAIRFARRLLAAQGAFTMAISIVLFAAAPPIVRILAGPGFEGAVPILRVMALIPFLVGVSNVLGVQLMLPSGHKRGFSRILTGAALVNLALVVPFTLAWGAIGTATATLLAEIYVTAAMLLALKRMNIPLFARAR